MIIYVYDAQMRLVQIDDRIYRRQGGGARPAPAPPPAPSGFNFVQPVPATVWNIPHNLGYFPNIQPSDTNGVVINNAEMLHIDTNNVQITFFFPVAGTARCA